MSTAAAPAEGPLAAAEARQLRFTAALEEVRKRADTTAKVFGALATTAVTAVGLTEIADLLPVPPGKGWLWVVLTVLSFVGLAVAVLLFTRQLWKAGAPIYTVSSLPDMARELPGGAGGREYTLVAKVYREAIENRSVTSQQNLCCLQQYEEMGNDLRRNAMPDETAPLTEAQQAAGVRADVISAEVAAAHARATALVARDRATRVVSSRSTAAIVLVFVASLILFGVATDWLETERDDARIALATSCGEAQKAIADGGGVGGVALPAACGSPAASSAPTPTTPLREKSVTLEALGTQWRACVASARQPADQAACDPTRRLMVQLGGSEP